MSEIIEILTGYESILQNTSLLLEGLHDLNQTVKKGSEVSEDNFFRYHLDVACGKLFGRILRITSKNDKPLGFISAAECTSDYADLRSLHVYAIYSNGKSPTATRTLFYALEKWAREVGFGEIQAISGRTSGASIRWCRQKFGLELSKMFFIKRL
jgi:hypothetical protein